VYPGRLYAEDVAQFAASTERLLAFAEARPVTRVLGCHIELAADGTEYPMGTLHQPDEAPLPLSMSDLATVAAGVRAARGRPGVHRVGPARLWNGPCRGAFARGALRLAWNRVLGVSRA
jgi:hydroxyacylglutathione hydrolase